MKSLAWGILGSLGLTLAVVGSSRGQVTVDHTAFVGAPQTITDISGFMTTGEDMGGMRVTAFFSADLTSSETVNWNPGGIGSMAGSAIGAQPWRLDQAGDTFFSAWRLSPTGTNLSLYGLRLEGFLPSQDPVSDRATVFDRTDPFFGTGGSFRGNDLDAVITAGNWTHLMVRYIDEVDNLADPLIGAQKDVYRAMQIQFGELVDVGGEFPLFNPIPFDFNDELVFLQDTDTVGERIPGDPGLEGMPEPGSLLLVMIGALVAGFRRYRRK
jgi:hypothetical protein